LGTVFITEDAKYASNTPSPDFETVKPALTISTQTTAVRLTFASLKALKLAAFAIMLLYIQAQWYYEEMIHEDVPCEDYIAKRDHHQDHIWISHTAELAHVLRPWLTPGLLHYPAVPTLPAWPTSLCFGIDSNGRVCGARARSPRPMRRTQSITSELAIYRADLLRLPSERPPWTS